MGRFSQLAVAATHEALEDSGLDMSKENPDRVGVLMGSGSGGLPETDQQATVKVKRGALRMSPLYIPVMLREHGGRQCQPYVRHDWLHQHLRHGLRGKHTGCR